MSLFAAKKIVKDKGQDPEPFELDVAQVRPRLKERVERAARRVRAGDADGLPPLTAPAQALCDLEANSNDLKAELRELYIVSAKGERSASAPEA